MFYLPKKKYSGLGLSGLRELRQMRWENGKKYQREQEAKGIARPERRALTYNAWVFRTKHHSFAPFPSGGKCLGCHDSLVTGRGANFLILNGRNLAQSGQRSRRRVKGPGFKSRPARTR